MADLFGIATLQATKVAIVVVVVVSIGAVNEFVTVIVLISLICKIQSFKSIFTTRISMLSVTPEINATTKENEIVVTVVGRVEIVRLLTIPMVNMADGDEDPQFRVLHNPSKYICAEGGV